MLWSSAEEAAAAAGSSPLPSPISLGNAGDLGRGSLEVPAPHRAPLARCATCIHIRIYLYVCVSICVCVRAWIHTSGETASRAWGAPALSGFCRRENRPGTGRPKPRGTRDEIFPGFFRFPLHFCIPLPLVAPAVSRGHLPRSPRPVVSVLPRPGPLPSSWGCPGSISRSSSLELFLPSVLTGCSRCLLGVYEEKIWQGLPSQQSPICSKRT